MSRDIDIKKEHEAAVINYYQHALFNFEENYFSSPLIILTMLALCLMQISIKAQNVAMT